MTFRGIFSRRETIGISSAIVCLFLSTTTTIFGQTIVSTDPCITYSEKIGTANWEMISIVDVLSALADDKAFVLYNAIALGQGHDFKTLIKNMGITPHQYH